MPVGLLLGLMAMLSLGSCHRTTPEVPSVAPAAPSQRTVIIAFGDSLTAGYGLDKQQSYPAQLESALMGADWWPKALPEPQVMNMGVSGDTTTGGLERWGWALSQNPQLIILCLGANDIFQGIDPALTEKNLSLMIGQAQEAGIPVILGGMRAPPNYGVRAKEFEAIFSRLGKLPGVTLVPFFLEGVAAHPSLNLPDGIHPTQAGYQKVVQHLLPFVQKLIQKIAG